MHSTTGWKRRDSPGPRRDKEASTAVNYRKGVLLAVIRHGPWQRRYGGSPNVSGREITLNDNALTFDLSCVSLWVEG